MLVHAPKDLALMVMDQRKKLKLSQSEVADRVGLKQKTISAFENKPENIKLETFFQILSAVNLDLNILPKNKPKKVNEEWKEEW